MALTALHATAGGIWALAAEQHGVVTRRQLRVSGLTPDAIAHRLATGRLHRVRRGVFAVGRPGLTRDGVLMATVLACGPGAVASHSSAAVLFGMIERASGPIEVTVPASRTVRQRGVKVHRRSLRSTDVTTHRGVPVTAPACTLLDLAQGQPPYRLERAINEADKLGLVDPEAMRDALAGFSGRRGVRPLRAALLQHTLTDSELERRFLPLAGQAGLDAPRTQQRVNGVRVDFYWPELGLVVETDGLRYHRTPSQQARDRRRDQVHAAAGMTPLRFTYSQVTFEPAYVQATLRRVASRLQHRA